MVDRTLVMASASPADAYVALMDRSNTGHSLVNNFSTSHIMQSNMAGGWKLGRCVEPKPGLYSPHTYQYEEIVPATQCTSFIDSGALPEAAWLRTKIQLSSLHVELSRQECLLRL